MSDPHIPPHPQSDDNSVPEPDRALPTERRLRRFAWIFAGSAAGLAVLLLLTYAVLSSSFFENLVRKRLIASLEDSTGGRARIASFSWHPLQLEADASGIILHGREAYGDEPYVRVNQIHAAVSILGLWNPHIRLRELDIERPTIHLIVYPDGSTNQPEPRRPTGTGKFTLKTLFDLRAGRITIRDGMLHYENRAAGFDAQNRHIPLNLTASNASLRLVYVPAANKTPESYRIEFGARNVSLVRGDPLHPAAPPVSGLVQATLDLTPAAAYLRSLRVTTHDSTSGDEALTLAGSITDFAHPHWQAQAQGQLDMRLLNSITGYSDSPEGLARLTLSAAGHDGTFRIDGPVHIDHGSYTGAGINARDVTVDTQFHADPQQLIIGNTVIRFPQGGTMDGQVALDHWLAPLPGEPALRSAPAPPAKRRLFRFSRSKPHIAATEPSAQPAPTHLNGRVTANFHGVSLDSILDVVSRPPFRRLGLSSLLTGTALATWTHGDVNTLAVSTKLELTPPANPQAAQKGGAGTPPEVPASGVIDATYTQRDGGVDLRALSIVLPGSTIHVNGHLGAYPLESASQLTVDLDSRNLGDFDRVLRDLGLHLNGKNGAAALPVSLGGEAHFHGMWTGSLINPHLTGTLNATNLVVDLPAATGSSQARSLRWDSVDATGSYASNRITADHADFRHGEASIHLQGSLTAASSAAGSHSRPGFDGNSVLSIQLSAAHVNVAELEPFVGLSIPASGQLSTQFQAEGPLHAVHGAGWVQIDHANLYDEPVDRIRAQGTLAGTELSLSSVTLSAPAGTATASGSYDLHSRQFTIQAQSTGLQLAAIQHLRNSSLSPAGAFGFTITGSGTPANPQLTVRGQLTGTTLAGETLGNVEIDAHTANRALMYALNTHFESAELTVRGQTELNDDYTTQATLRFSRFDIGIPLKLLHVPGLTGQSALAGVITLSGPLRKPGELRGEATLQDLAATVVGVHLRSQGPVHAALNDERISLDPIHITGEETDLHLQGSVDLK
ncbi:MAG TPA: hypothetical protein VFU68_02670, partial [Terracidiphilus sp.]|nr:hypothetical protein [Terracidiphilus sp.]